MASKDNFNRTVRRVDDDSYIDSNLSENWYGSASEICNSPPSDGDRQRPQAGGGSGAWEALRAAQDSDVRVSTDINMLRKETADLRAKNSAMYKAMVELKSDNQQLRNDVRVLHDLVLSGKASSLQIDPQRAASGAGDLQGEARRQGAIISGLQNDIRKMQDELDVFRTEGVALRNELGQAKSEMAALKTENATVNSKMASLTKENATVKSDMAALRAANAGVKPAITGNKSNDGETARLTSNIRSIESKAADLNRQFEDLKSQLDEIRGAGRVVHDGFNCDACNVKPIVGTRYRCQTCDDYDLCHTCYKKNVHSHHNMTMFREKIPRIAAFTVSVGEDVTLSADTKLTCKELLFSSNRSSEYNPNTGEFVVQTQGIYFFILTVSPADDGLAAAFIMCEQDPLVYVRAQGKGAYSTGHVVTLLLKGDRVWLKNSSHTSSFMKSRTTFSGYSVQLHL